MFHVCIYHVSCVGFGNSYTTIIVVSPWLYISYAPCVCRGNSYTSIIEAHDHKHIHSGHEDMLIHEFFGMLMHPICLLGSAAASYL